MINLLLLSSTHEFLFSEWKLNPFLIEVVYRNFSCSIKKHMHIESMHEGKNKQTAYYVLGLDCKLRLLTGYVENQSKVEKNANFVENVVIAKVCYSVAFDGLGPLTLGTNRPWASW